MDTQIENNNELNYEKIAWGTSLPVPSVQELVRNNHKEVPLRYIQNNEKRPVTIFEPFQESAEIPIINFSLLANGDEDERNKLHLACKEWGFFQIWSNGMYKSIEHRAVTNKEKVRISIATNVFPADTRELEPVETMTNEQRPSMYKKVKFLDLIKYGMAKTMDGKIFIEFAKEEDNQGP